MKIQKVLLFVLSFLVFLYLVKVFRENEDGDTKPADVLKQIMAVSGGKTPSMEQAQSIVDLCKSNNVSSYPTCLQSPPADIKDPYGFGPTPPRDGIAQAFIASACNKASLMTGNSRSMCPGITSVPGFG
jgi:hypothetical protein